MSDGHFYNCKGEPFLTKATTPAQAKKLKMDTGLTLKMGYPLSLLLSVVQFTQG
jgi:hypothetical protein